MEAQRRKERRAINIEQAIDDAAQASDARLRKSYEVALAHGATNTVGLLAVVWLLTRARRAVTRLSAGRQAR